MILYTPMPHSEIYAASNDEFTRFQSVSYRGKACLAEQQQDGSYQLKQLLSTDPQDFLDEQFTPGTIFS
jgi:hypothetical protein